MIFLSVLSVMATVFYLGGRAWREGYDTRTARPPLLKETSRQDDLVSILYEAWSGRGLRDAEKLFSELIGRPVPLQYYAPNWPLGQRKPWQSLLCFIAEKEGWFFHDPGDSFLPFHRLNEGSGRFYIERNMDWSDLQKTYNRWYNEACWRYRKGAEEIGMGIWEYAEDHGDKESYFRAIRESVNFCRRLEGLEEMPQKPE